MTPQDLVTIFLWEHFIALVTVAIILIMRNRWKIPVIVLRYTGDKRRPVVIITKARRESGGLRIKGYKIAVRNYDSENYYPSAKGTLGALILWEFKRGWLTPSIPKKTLMKLSEEQRAQIETALAYLEEKSVVKFEFNEEMYAHLMLESIDDVDAEYFLTQLQRQAMQYTGGLKDFLMKHSTTASKRRKTSRRN